MKSYVKFLCMVAFFFCMSVCSPTIPTVWSKSTGKQNILVILVRFPDVNPSLSPEQLKEKYFVKLNQYLKAVSYNQTSIEGKVTDWHTLPRGVDHYRLSRHNLEVKKTNVFELIQDAVDLADEEELSRYDMIFISLGAKHSDYGMMGLCGYPGMLGWQNQLPVKTKTKQQAIPQGVAIFCENAHVGVVFHDMAHILGGIQQGKRVLPCLYDHDLQAAKGPFRDHYQFYLINVGYFDPMSCHFYDLKQGPPGVCAWTKLRLGWIAPNRIVEIDRGTSKSLGIGPLSSGKSEVCAVKVPITSTTYYLIENRQPIGPDKNLPCHGVLVFFCDDEVAECRHGKSPVKLIDADPAIPQLRSAAFTVDGNNTFEDEVNHISIRILGQDGAKYRVVVSNGI